MVFLRTCFGNIGRRDIDDDDEDKITVVDSDAVHLSYVGKAAYEVLRSEYGGQHHALWNATLGSLVSNTLDQTPPHEVVSSSEGLDPVGKHSDWLPDKMGDMLSRTKVWADVMSLGPPDGLFMEAFQNALQKVAIRAHQDDKIVTVRMMFGNIIGMPLNCNELILKLTTLVPAECQNNLHMWVGAWRKGVSWNHAKLIAVDGLYLHTGGHNMWDYHYLKDSPVYDLSMELAGPICHDGHLFANDQWDFIESIQTTCCGEFIDKLPDNMPLIARTRVAVSEHPKGRTTIFPPPYQRKLVRDVKKTKEGDDDHKENNVPMLSVGRYGSLLKYYRPADAAFVAMFNASQKHIRLTLQDLGPVCIPKTNVALPGCVWPKDYLTCFGNALMRGVDVDIILSNPNSIPGGLSPTEANYGNGWDCNEVASEIAKCMKNSNSDASLETIRQHLQDHLKVCFIKRSALHRSKYESDMTIGLHSKHFIIDDQTAYVGSQNLYICDLAEWGVVIDHQPTVAAMMEQYWIPLWQTSYDGTDMNLDTVMATLDTRRDGEAVSMFDTDNWKHQQEAAVRGTGMGISTRKLGKDDIADTDVEDN